MADAAIQRTTLGGVLLAMAQVVRRKGLVLLALAIAIGVLPGSLVTQWWPILQPGGEAANRWTLILLSWSLQAALFCATAALALSDLQSDSYRPRVLVQKALRRWFPVLAVVVALSSGQLATTLSYDFNPDRTAINLRALGATLAGFGVFSLVLAATLALVIPVLLQESGGLIRALRRAIGLARGARVALAVLALARGLAFYPIFMLNRLNLPQALPFRAELPALCYAFINMLWVIALCATYLKQRRARGELAEQSIGEVFD